jgi:hypothetical protein
MKPARKLFDIKPSEVSIVGKPANQVKFLTFKDDGKLEVNIISDGTPAGTIIKVNGEEIKDLSSLSIWYQKPLPNAPAGSIYGPALSCSYSKVVNMENGFAQTETFTLNKGDCMDKELEKLLKSYFGDKWAVAKKDLTEEAVKALKDALTSVNKYKDEFPDELKSAVGVLADYASSGYGYPEKKETDEEKKKRLEAEAAAAAAAKKGDDAVSKIAETLKADIAKSVADLTKAVTDSTEASKKMATDVSDLAKRLEVVEKTAQVRKGVEGQDTANNGDNANPKDNFPSIPI